MNASTATKLLSFATLQWQNINGDQDEHIIRRVLRSAARPLCISLVRLHGWTCQRDNAHALDRQGQACTYIRHADFVLYDKSMYCTYQHLFPFRFLFQKQSSGGQCNRHRHHYHHYRHPRSSQTFSHPRREACIHTYIHTYIQKSKHTSNRIESNRIQFNPRLFSLFSFCFPLTCASDPSRSLFHTCVGAGSWAGTGPALPLPVLLPLPRR